jgi:hypothetical protein
MSDRPNNHPMLVIAFSTQLPLCLASRPKRLRYFVLYL